MDDRKYYSLFDGEEVAGKRYNLGDPIDGDVHPAVLEILASQGRLTTSRPAILAASPIPTETKVADMSRAELERAALEGTAARIKAMSDDDLREGVERMRAQAADAGENDDDKGAGDGSTGGTAYADLKDKPLASLKTADLDTIAREESVSFEGAKNNPDRVKAIEAARAAKSSS